MANNQPLFFFRRFFARIILWMRIWVELIESCIAIITFTLYQPYWNFAFIKFSLFIDQQILSLYEKLLDKYQTPISDRHQTF